MASVRHAKPARIQHFYRVYGVSLSSDISLALGPRSQDEASDIEILTAPANFFARAIRGARFQEGPPNWYHYAHLKDLSSYVRWEGLGEFIVSRDGHQVYCRKFPRALSESFQVYLLGRAFSFALVKQGLEPLHSTSVVVDGEAIAFLGNSGFGKSSLAACFMARGHELLTDDLLLLRRGADGLRAYPGPPRIKLFPAMASLFLGSAVDGVPMNHGTRKLVLPLAPHQLCSEAVPLRAIYVLQSPRETGRKHRIRLTPLDPREAFVELLRSTFNYLYIAPDRLRRQFTDACNLANTVTFKKLSHPRVVRHLPAVRDAILADLSSAPRQAAYGI